MTGHENWLRVAGNLACLLLTWIAGATGCASLAQLQPDPLPIAVPAAWSVPAAALEIAADPGLAVTAVDDARAAPWWSDFDDPLLASLVDTALARNVDVLRANADLRQSRALRDEAAAALWPTLDVGAEVQRDINGNGRAAERYGAGLDAAWEVDVFGGQRAGLRARTAVLDASVESLDDARLVIARELVTTYIEMRGAQARAAIASANADIQAETLQIARWRVQAGLATALDVAQSGAALAQTYAQRDALQVDVLAGMHAIAVLSGAPPASLDARLARASPIPRVDSDGDSSTSSARSPADVLVRRPDVRAAELRIIAAVAEVSRADAERLPSVHLAGSLGVSALSVEDLSTGDALVRALLASISVPLFDAGGRRAAVRAEEALLELARVEHAASVLTALQEVEDALTNLRGDTARLAHLRAAATHAATAALLARQRYGSGLVDFLAVLDTQRTLLATEDAVAAAQVTLGIDHARLCTALVIRPGAAAAWAPAMAAAHR